MFFFLISLRAPYDVYFSGSPASPLVLCAAILCERPRYLGNVDDSFELRSFHIFFVEVILLCLY